MLSCLLRAKILFREKEDFNFFENIHTTDLPTNIPLVKFNKEWDLTVIAHHCLLVS